MGVPLNDEQYHDIQNWIPPPGIIEGGSTSSISIRPTSRNPHRTIDGAFVFSNTMVHGTDDFVSESDTDRGLTTGELAPANMICRKYPKAESQTCRAMITPDLSNQVATSNEYLSQAYISKNTSEVLDCPLMTPGPASSVRMVNTSSLVSPNEIKRYVSLSSHEPATFLPRTENVTRLM
jgi:hypothetical protein